MASQGEDGVRTPDRLAFVRAVSPENTRGEGRGSKYTRSVLSAGGFFGMGREKAGINARSKRPLRDFQGLEGGPGKYSVNLKNT